MQLKLEKRMCNGCGEEIPEGRLKAIPTTTRCVKCSTVKPKRPVILQLGEKDHTYNETIFLDADEYARYEEVENLMYKKKLLNNVEDVVRPINKIEEIKNWE